MSKDYKSLKEHLECKLKVDFTYDENGIPTGIGIFCVDHDEMLVWYPRPSAYIRTLGTS